ncbi:protein TBATA isoform X3 [Camelus bactrianus]|uniref:Protein TBATA isoform X3 n=1 Tax=Camelus bactrianus TaxID=9837 RepID=A0AC58R6U7_CAMBA
MFCSRAALPSLTQAISSTQPFTRQISTEYLTGKPVCVVRDGFSLAASPQATLLSRYLIRMPTISVPIGDPQSNRDPRLPSEAWRKELKDLASRVAIFTKENELKNKKQKEEPQREQGAKYSAETGRLIPASTQAMARRHSCQGLRNHPSSRDGGVQTFILQDQELLILELLSQILQTDSLNAIQFWLLYAPPKEKDMALGLLQTAVAQLLPQPLLSISAEKLLNQLQGVQELSQERQQLPYSQSPKKTKTPPLSNSEKPEHCPAHINSDDPVHTKLVCIRLQSRLGDGWGFAVNPANRFMVLLGIRSPLSLWKPLLVSHTLLPGMLAFETTPSSVITAPRDKAMDSVTPDAPDSPPSFPII